MTVNERLYEARLIDAFDEAVRTRQRAKIIELLISIDIEPAEATQTTDKLLERTP
jgi:hypothetical protein